MKVSKEKVAENREALVRAAGRMFRERGIDGVGVAEISKNAGLTSGALYAQFQSKQELAAEALAYGLERGYERMVAAGLNAQAPLTGFLDFYVSRRQRDDMAGSCPMIASASEIARQDGAVSTSFTQGFLRTVDAFEKSLGDVGCTSNRRQRSLAIVAGMIGGVAVASATAKPDPKLSDELLAAVRQVLGEVGGEPRPSKRKRNRQNPIRS